MRFVSLRKNFWKESVISKIVHELVLIARQITVLVQFSGPRRRPDNAKINFLLVVVPTDDLARLEIQIAEVVENSLLTCTIFYVLNPSFALEILILVDRSSFLFFTIYHKGACRIPSGRKICFRSCRGTEGRPR